MLSLLVQSENLLKLSYATTVPNSDLISERAYA